MSPSVHKNTFSYNNHLVTVQYPLYDLVVRVAGLVVRMAGLVIRVAGLTQRGLAETRCSTSLAVAKGDRILRLLRRPLVSTLEQSGRRAGPVHPAALQHKDCLPYLSAATHVGDALSRLHLFSPRRVAGVV